MSGGANALAEEDDKLLTFQISARAQDMRALVGAAALGSVVGLAIGGAYLAGGLARTAVVHARISRLADTAQAGFSEDALKVAAKGAPGALAIARRHDPMSGSVQEARDRRLDEWADQLQAHHGSSNGLMLASFGSSHMDAQRVLRMRGALDQSRDLECLTQAVYYEARGETPQGQAAVAQVVMNRVRHRAFPKTVCGVVFQGAYDGGCQFSFACDGSVRKTTDQEAWDRAQKVAARALDGRIFAAVGGATHFHVAGVITDWGDRMAPVAQIGAHIFYRFNARPGASGVFHGPVDLSPAEPSPNPTTPVYASLAPASAAAPPPASAASLFLATTAAAVEHAASVVESAAKPVVPKPDLPKPEDAGKGAP